MAICDKAWGKDGCCGNGYTESGRARCPECVKAYGPIGPPSASTIALGLAFSGDDDEAAELMVKEISKNLKGLSDSDIESLANAKKILLGRKKEGQ